MMKPAIFITQSTDLFTPILPLFAAGAVIDSLATTPPDSTKLIFLDMAFPNSQTLLSTLTTHNSVIAMSQHLSIKQLQQLLMTGVKGYIALESPAEQYQAAATAVLHGALWIPPALVLHLSKVLTAQFSRQSSSMSQDSHTLLNNLTDREKQVAELAAKGISNKLISQQLHITERTVKQHLTNSFAKLGIKDRLQLVLVMR